jgi:hypothetical protein
MMLRSSVLVMLMVATLVASAVESTCNVTYRIYDVDLEAYYVDLVGDDDVSYPPCKINIEAVVKCETPFKGVVRMQLRDGDGSLVKSKTEKKVPYFLYGDFQGKIRASPHLDGKYEIQSSLNEKATKPIRFTMYPCVPSHL